VKKLLTTLSILLIATASYAQGKVYTETELKVQLPFGEAKSTESSKTYTVERVIDGETLKLKNGDIVRLIGIYATERFPTDGAVFGVGTEKVIAEFVRGLNIEGKEVRLEFDVQEGDTRGWLWAYVFIDTPGGPLDKVPDYNTNYPHYLLHRLHMYTFFLNATIIKSGYATPMTIPPNVKYAELFQELSEGAREQGRGFWKDKLSNSYFEDFLYCERNEDCSIREGACGPEPMNIHFDNKKLLEMSAFIDCMEPASLTNPRCEDNKCVVDAV